ncbi:MAG: T9SS type A sorting domain-containing protein [Bacteroidetes bacterium]|nr:T9SS type A sorting domain-containing protein [Bacteroidota bacterium]
MSTDVPSFIVTVSAFTTTLTALTVYVNNTTTGITEKTKTNNLFQKLTVAGLKTANLNVYNQLGSLVKQQAFDNETIALNIADLPQGVYMVEVLTDGKKIVSKLVKE